MADGDDGGQANGFWTGSNVWVLIPAMALLIPIIAVVSTAESTAITVAVAIAIVMIVGALAARMLMTHRHQLKMAELRGAAELSSADAQQLEQANRILQQNAEIRRLREAVSQAGAAPADAKGVLDLEA